MLTSKSVCSTGRTTLKNSELSQYLVLWSRNFKLLWLIEWFLWGAVSAARSSESKRRQGVSTHSKKILVMSVQTLEALVFGSIWYHHRDQWFSCELDHWQSGDCGWWVQLTWLSRVGTYPASPEIASF